MNRHAKILLAVFTLCFVAIVVNITWVQIFGAEGIQENPYNRRRLVEEYAILRGEITSADGQVLARSVDTGTEYRYQREYPLGPLCTDITGYDSWRYGRTGLEKTYNRELLGKGSSSGLLDTSKKGNSIELTVDTRVQRAARDALGGRRGAVVALDPKSGEVLAMVTGPTFDANDVVPLPGRDVRGNWDALKDDPGKPLINRGTDDRYPPGSSFKVVTASAALDLGVVNSESPFECEGKLPVRGYTIHDFGRRSHGQLNFAKALTVSCNITFAQVGLRLGAEALVRYAELYGFNHEIPFDLPVVESRIQKPGEMDAVDLASSAFGQGEVVATPLQMALVAAGVANDGVVMKPRLVSSIRDYNGKVTKQFTSSLWQDVIDRETARTLTRMMVDVVEEGTGTAARIDGVAVAGKTGTAEVENEAPHAWFICFAPAYNPRVAVSVFVENGGEGGRTAAPVARRVVEAALSL